MHIPAYSRLNNSYRNVNFSARKQSIRDRSLRASHGCRDRYYHPLQDHPNLHFPIYPSHCNSDIPSHRVPKRFIRSSFYWMPYKDYLFWRKGSRPILICPPIPDNVHFLTSLLLCFSPSPSYSLQRECVWGHTRACTQLGSPPWSHLGGMSRRLGSKKSGRISSCVCVHPRVLFLALLFRLSPTTPDFRE